MTLGELFTGIGGFTEGAQRAGLKTIFQVEKDTWRREIILPKHEPHANRYGDVRDFDGTKYKGHIDILAGGFPCQNISPAAQDPAGIKGEQSALWSEFSRVIRETNPDYVLIENSYLLRKKGLGIVLSDLAESGYDAEWETISTKAFGMPHDRRRLFIIAYTNEIGRRSLLRGNVGSIFKAIERQERKAFAAETDCLVWYEKSMGEPALLRVDNGLSRRAHLLPRLAGVGDAVSPVVAEYLFHCLKLHHQNLHLHKI